MAYNTIRIESNPYTKEVRYFWKNDDGEESNLADNKTSPFARSKSRYKEFSEATIAHKAYDILEQINTVYNKGNNGIEIVVDGTVDDFNEFKNVIDSSFQGSGMICKQGDMYILSAKEAMPQIENIYSSLERILSEHFDGEIKDLIARYTETVKPEVSICVMGLYSSGKSSFINSIIGKEILPSASDPATAKIYKINCDNSVWLKFEFDGVEYHIDFGENEWKINVSPDAEIVENIIDEINKEKNRDRQLYATLSVLNQYAIREGKERQNQIEQMAEKDGISLSEFLDKNSITDLVEKGLIEEYKLADLIEIGVPFNTNTLLPIKDFKFVIFDTPGSNSEMHKEHVEILKKSLADRTNGLPIFVTNADTLDNTDNAPVINMIETMGSALDGTSTMIVVNKADEKSKNALMQKREKTSELKVTSWKPSRIYFVSSVISLGEKIEDPIKPESWMDQEYADIYYDNYKKFDGSDERSLLQLYKYDILPQNIQDEIEKIVENSTTEENILWNTGIRSIEREISNFGERFALYNKCVQAEKYLEKAIEILKDKIKQTSEEVSKTHEEIEEEIEDAVKNLEKELNKKCDEEKEKLETNFALKIVGPATGTFLDLNRVSGVVKNVESIAQKNEKDWKESGLFKSAKNSTSYVRYVKKNISKKFDEDVVNYAKAINESSDNFWDVGIDQLKKDLLEVVYESPDLTDEQKEIAKEAVMQVKKMFISHSDLKLGEGNGTVGKQILWIKWDEFDSAAAINQYRTSLKNEIERKNQGIIIDNSDSFSNWKTRMIDVLRAKLSILNPKVIELNKKLVHCQEMCDDLADQLKQAEKAKYEIGQLLIFREV